MKIVLFAIILIGSVAAGFVYYRLCEETTLEIWKRLREKGGKECLRKKVLRPRLHQNYLSSFLRSQISTLQNVLRNVESSQENYDRYFNESMWRVELEMRRFRKRLYN